MSTIRNALDCVRSWYVTLIVLGNLCLFIFEAFHNPPILSEARFISAGIQMWTEGNFQLADDIPPLPRALAVLPILARSVQIKPLAQDDVSDEHIGKRELRVARDLAAGYGDQFQTMVGFARLIGLVWWGLGAWIVYHWARGLCGETAGKLGLTLWCFEPNILARESLATPELPTTVVCVGATYLFCHWLKVRHWDAALGAGAALGVALLTEFTALMLPVLWLIIAAVANRGLTRAGSLPTGVNKQIGAVVLMLVSSVWIVNLGYGFSDSGLSIRQMGLSGAIQEKQTQGPRIDPMDPGQARASLWGSWVADMNIPLPAEYLRGLCRRWRQAEPRDVPADVGAGLGSGSIDWGIADRGQFSWAIFFGKVPLGMWVLLVASLFPAVSRIAGTAVLDSRALWGTIAVAPLLAATVMRFLVSASGLSLATPFAIITISGLGQCLHTGSKGARWFVAGTLIWVVLSSLAYVPDSLDYVNEVAWGLEKFAGKIPYAAPGDCGKDIPRLVRWMERHPEAKTMEWASWSLIDPKTFRVSNSRIPVSPGPWVAEIPWYARRIGPHPGYFALDLAHQAMPQYGYFRMFQPSARLGPSIRVYRITEDQAEWARHILGLPGLSDAAMLKDWLANRVETGSIGLDCGDIPNPKQLGLGIVYPKPPTAVGPELAKAQWYTLRFGPYPGDYVLDMRALTKKRYRYFKQFEPMSRIGSSLITYSIERTSADQVRKRLGLPLLDADGADKTRHSEAGVFRHYSHGSGDHEEKYSLFVPKDYTGEKPYPLIVFLHGFGDWGPEPLKYVGVGLPAVVEKRKNVFGFLVLCPWSPSGHWPVGGADATRAMALLEQIETDYRVDRSRIYLTGVSSGATGVWDLAAAYPDRWAAIVPISSGGCDPAKASIIKHIPTWCFHNMDDVDFPPDIPRKMIRALRIAGGTPRYTEWPELYLSDHNAWDGAYHMDDLYEWLIRQSVPREHVVQSVIGSARGHELSGRPDDRP